MSMDINDVRVKLAGLREFFGDNAQRMTCEEVTDLVDLYIGIADVDGAIDILTSHTTDEDEEEGDMHYQWDEAKCAQWVTDRIVEEIER